MSETLGSIPSTEKKSVHVWGGVGGRKVFQKTRMGMKIMKKGTNDTGLRSLVLQEDEAGISQVQD